jgi:hypothetical protein
MRAPGWSEKPGATSFGLKVRNLIFGLEAILGGGTDEKDACDDD